MNPYVELKLEHHLLRVVYYDGAWWTYVDELRRFVSHTRRHISDTRWTSLVNQMLQEATYNACIELNMSYNLMTVYTAKWKKRVDPNRRVFVNATCIRKTLESICGGIYKHNFNDQKEVTAALEAQIDNAPTPPLAPRIKFTLSGNHPHHVAKDVHPTPLVSNDKPVVKKERSLVNNNDKPLVSNDKPLVKKENTASGFDVNASYIRNYPLTPPKKQKVQGAPINNDTQEDDNGESRLLPEPTSAVNNMSTPDPKVFIEACLALPSFRQVVIEECMKRPDIQAAARQQLVNDPALRQSVVDDYLKTIRRKMMTLLETPSSTTTTTPKKRKKPSTTASTK